ncbi:MAG: nucleotidyl transferase AbiEii/AbiGii toxin family protein, partial [Patescibacteria group bacterium]|nr:nucleotidyl transferase AbiEii/AbiGii toxin family protein [Patescibacteria group bacterium]
IIEKGAFHCYIKFPRLLQSFKLSNLEAEKILVRIDTVKKEKHFKPQLFILNKFDVYRSILVNPIDIILSQKLMAIIGRHRKKGRDFYDVSYLYNKTEVNFSYILKNYSLNKKDFFKKLLTVCHDLDFKALSKDVEPFLIFPEQAKRVIDFESFIKTKIL